MRPSDELRKIGNEDRRQRGMVSRPGRSGAFTGNDAEDSKRIIHAYAQDLDACQERARQLQSQVDTMREALERVNHMAHSIIRKDGESNEYAVVRRLFEIADVCRQAAAATPPQPERIKEGDE